MRRKVCIVLGKELRERFYSPLAYVVIAGLTLFAAVWLFAVVDFFSLGQATLRPLFAVLPYAFGVFASVITMRSWAGEREQGTSETLLSFPLNEGSIVVGKFSADVLVLLAAVMTTLPIPVLIAPLARLDAGEMVGQYLGLVLFIMTAASVGQLCSAIARSQIVAFVLSVLVLVGWLLVGEVARSAAGRWFFPVLEYLALTRRLENFTRGLLHTGDLLFFLTSTAMLLCVTTIVVKRRRSL